VRLPTQEIPQLQTPPGPVPKTGAWEGAAKFGETLARASLGIAERIEARKDMLAAREADRQLALYELSLDDPKTGVLVTRKGKDAEGLTQQVGQDFTDRRGKLYATMKTQHQRDLFNEFADRRQLQILDRVQKHEAQQEEVWAQASTQADVVTAQNLAVQNFSDPDRRKAEIDNVRKAVAADTALNGLPEAYRQLKTGIEVAKAHGMIMDRMLANGQDLAAKEYLEQYKKEFVGDQLAKYEEKVEVANSETLGSIAAEEIWKAHGPQTDTDPVNLDQMLEAARKVFPDDPKKYDATKKSLAERSSAFNEGREQRSTANEASVWKHVLAGATLDEVGTLPEYLSLNGQAQEKVRTAIEDRLYVIKQRGRGEDNWLWETQQRDRTRREQAEADRTKAAFAGYLRLSEPNELIQHSEEDLIRRLPELGERLTTDLVERRRALLNAPDKVRNATIDEDLFNQLADQAGLKPYAPAAKRTDTDNARLGALKSTVLDRIAQEQRANGKELSRDQKRAIMQEEIDRKVTLSVPWYRKGSGVTVPESTLRPGEPRPRIALEAIPENDQPFVDEALNYLRSIGVVPQGLAPMLARETYRIRIESAYALRVHGGTRAEIEAALRGQ